VIEHVLTYRTSVFPIALAIAPNDGARGVLTQTLETLLHLFAILLIMTNRHRLSRRSSLQDKIDLYGFTMIAVGTGYCESPGCRCVPEEPWGYTIGLSRYAMPEYVVTGLGAEHTCRALDAAAQRALVADPIWVGSCADIDGLRVRADAVSDAWLLESRSRMAARWDVLDDWPDVVQIVWSDHRGLLPDEVGCDPTVRHVQPLLAVDPIGYPPPG
jgi:hypothetical protein